MNNRVFKRHWSGLLVLWTLVLSLALLIPPPSTSERPCRIERVGVVLEWSGWTIISGWSFDCTTSEAPPVSIDLFAGYSISELKRIDETQRYGVLISKSFDDDWWQ